jgi:BirA family biotin operon repressor/biotin-[acetyl-CoA-carboxylase] ligase
MPDGVMSQADIMSTRFAASMDTGMGIEVVAGTDQLDEGRRGLPLTLVRLLSTVDARAPDWLAAQAAAPVEAVTEALRLLPSLGVALTGSADAVRLASPVDLISRTELDAFLEDQPGLRVELLDECDSTNARLSGRRDAPGGSVLACEYQSAGRGRRGRAWNSGIGAALTFSLLWRFAASPAALAGLSLAVAVMVARALERQGCSGIRLKWPNDLLYREAKVGGILIELASRHEAHGAIDPPPRESVCIIGIGLNVRLPPAVARDIDRPVSDLAASCAQPASLPSRTQLLAAVLRELAMQLPLFETAGFAAFREDWLARHAHQGREVSIVLDGRTLMQGRVEGIGEDGSLMLQSQGRLLPVHSGEVSLRIE